MSCHVMSCHVMSCHVMSCHVMSCHVMSCHVMSCHVMSCHVMSCHAMPCHAMPCHAMPCHAMPCHAMPCHAMPCHAMPCHVSLNMAVPSQSWIGYSYFINTVENVQLCLSHICNSLCFSYINVEGNQLHLIGFGLVLLSSDIFLSIKSRHNCYMFIY